MTVDKIRRLQLGMVSYKGTGKYDHSTFWYWHGIPDSQHHDLDRELFMEDLGPPPLPPGQGWWPVIAIKLK